jgi:hypothetical protein
MGLNSICQRRVERQCCCSLMRACRSPRALFALHHEGRLLALPPTPKKRSGRMTGCIEERELAAWGVHTTPPLERTCEIVISPPLFLCLVARYHHWQIESALEFHPVYWKEDLVLLNTAFSFHTGRLELLVLLPREGGREGDVVGLFSVRIPASYSTPCNHL